MTLPIIERGQKLTERRSEEHTSELQSHLNLVCRLLLEKKKSTQCRCLCSRSQCGSLPVLYIHPHTLSVCVHIAQRVSAKGRCCSCVYCFFFFNNPAPPEIYPLPLRAALPI